MLNFLKQTLKLMVTLPLITVAGIRILLTNNSLNIGNTIVGIIGIGILLGFGALFGICLLLQLVGIPMFVSIPLLYTLMCAYVAATS